MTHIKMLDEITTADLNEPQNDSYSQAYSDGFHAALRLFRGLARSGDDTKAREIIGRACDAIHQTGTAMGLRK